MRTARNSEASNCSLRRRSSALLGPLRIPHGSSAVCCCLNCAYSQIDRWSPTDLMVPPSTLLKVESYLRLHHLPYSVMMSDVGAEIFRERIQKISHQQMHGNDVSKYADPDAFFTTYHPLADIVTFCEGLVTAVSRGEGLEKP